MLCTSFRVVAKITESVAVGFVIASIVLITINIHGYRRCATIRFITRDCPATEKTGDGTFAREAAFSVLTVVRYNSATTLNDSLTTANRCRYGDVTTLCGVFRTACPI